MKITPRKIAKAFRYLKEHGWQGFADRLCERLWVESAPYAPWYEEHKTKEAQLINQRRLIDKWEEKPLVSLCVPLYDTPEEYLCAMLDSVAAQTYTNWQLCLADGTPGDRVEKLIGAYGDMQGRIRYKHLEKNLGIAENTNEAFRMAEGTWIGLLDHDDMLAADALYEALLAAGNTFGAVYTDEDKISADGREHLYPHYKPDFNPDLLRSNNYITHFFMVKREIVERVGGFRSEFDGAQDYDFIFRCAAVSSVAHVPKILYHWRMTGGSTAANQGSKLYAFEAGRRVIESQLSEKGIPAEVTQTRELGFYRVNYRVRGNPLVTIIIPSKDVCGSLKRCISSIEASVGEDGYANYEILVVECGSTSREIFDYYEELKCRPGVRVVSYEGEAGRSRINNYGAGLAEGEYLLFLSHNTRIITKDFLAGLLGNCQRDEVAVVGAKLFYPDNTVRHAGIVVGMSGVAGEVFAGMRQSRSGYLHRASTQMNYSAVTAACMMVKKSVFEKAGGFTQELASAFYDVDLCLKIGEAGYLIVYDPWVRLYQYEAKPRRGRKAASRKADFEREEAYMRERWEEILIKGDPCYNPNLSLTRADYSRKP